MSIELRIASGARAGDRERFEKTAITIGRHPRNDLRFDAERDIDVSAYHAELRGSGGDRWVIRDLQSTNGTYVNAERLASGTERALKDRDVLTFGEHGPRVEIRILRPGEPATMAPPASAPSARTTESVATAVRRETAALRIALAALALLLVAGIGAAWWMGRRDAQRRDAAIDSLLARNAALGAQYDRDIARLTGRLGGVDSALLTAKREGDSLRLLIERDARAGRDLSALSARQQVAERHRVSLIAVSQLDYPAIAAANGPAVALIAVEMADGRTYAGTGFNVDPAGRLVTNRHLVVDEGGYWPRRLAVLFADTRVWLPARLERVSDTVDLALVVLEVPGSYPVVRAMAPADAVPPVGSPVALIGYPLGTGTPMEGTGTAIIARTSLGAGMVSKALADVLQIDAYAGPGSSGSPVFDGEGRVAGVVFGGATGSAGRIVLALPVKVLETFLR